MSVALYQTLYPHPTDPDLVYENYESSEPIFTPTGARNARKARCANCTRPVAKGQAHQWDYTPKVRSQLYGSRPEYYCTPCHEHRLELARNQPRIDRAMAVIEPWLTEYLGNLDMAAKGQIEGILHRSGLQAAEVAEAIAERLPGLREASYVAVIRLARNMAASVEGGM